MASATTPQIRLDDRGRAVIDDTRMKVKMLVLSRIAHGWGIDELQTQYPHLSREQVEAALVYYDAHRAEMDAEIEREYREVQELRARQSPKQPTREELVARLEAMRASGKRP